ncbi:MAG: hypothetical protein KC417_06390, partial [Myxococcales bacterium]|nr:hypothetical protein [Myxococcales bacterium]
DGGDGGNTATDMNVSKNIKASEGGNIQNEDVDLDIPPDALPEDKTIEVNGLKEEDLPNSELLLSEAFDFKPDGQTFDTPVKLTFKNVTIPAGKFVDVAFLNDENEWEALPFTDVDGTTVMSWTTHFTSFAVLLRTEAQFDGACEQDFDDCGGDITGVWTPGGDDNCATLPFTLATDSIPADCTGVMGNVSLDSGGYLSFLEPESANDPAPYYSGGGYAFWGAFSVPKSCFENSTCPENYDAGDTECLGGSGDEEGWPYNSGRWEASGGQLTFVELVEGQNGLVDGERRSVQYCVDTKGDQNPANDTLKLRFTSQGDGPSEYVITAVRNTNPI